MVRLKGRQREKHKGISRIEQAEKHTIGWYARVTFRGQTHSKFFSDRTYGGTEAALQKALRWRNATEKELGKPRTDRVVVAKETRNETGVPGVYRMGNQYVVAWNPEPGVMERELVSITKYGEEGALARAQALRLRKERQVYGKTLSTTPKPKVKQKAPAKPSSAKRSAGGARGRR